MPQIKNQHLLREPNPLPTIPAVAMKIIQLARDSEVSISKLARTMQADPALAAKTLRFANSAYYSSGTPIASLQQAIVRLGLRGTKLLALSFSLLGICRKDDGDFDYDDFWQRSLCQAVIARRLAVMHAPHLVEEGMLTGLLADVGSPILAREHPAAYSSIAMRHRLMQQDHAAAEKQALDTDHARIGADLLEQWGLPQIVCTAVRLHHQQQDRPTGTDDAVQLATIVHAAGELTSTLLYGQDPKRMRRLAEIFKHHFHFDSDRMRALIDTVGPEVAQFAQLLELPVPPHDQVERLARAEMLAVAMSPEASGQSNQDVSRG